MRKFFAIFFGALALLSFVVWMVGIVAAVVLPLFGGVRLDRIGAICFGLSLFGETFVFCFGWIARWLGWGRSVTGLPGPKRYGNKKPMTEL